jgi:bifunctional non-homologous end joining protein LigD
MSDQLSLHLEAALPRLPVSIRPMLARPAPAPFDSAEHLFEPSWGGERALAFVEPDLEAPPDRRRDVRILDAHGRDLGPVLPELHGLAGRVAARSVVLDGELVVVDADGRGDPVALAGRLAGGPGRPVAFLVFDVLYVDGRPLLALPLERRRAVLRGILTAGDEVVAVPAIAGEGRALFEAVSAQGIAGLTARELRGPYLPGVRSRLWRTVAAGPGPLPGYAGAATAADLPDLPDLPARSAGGPPATSPTDGAAVTVVPAGAPTAPVLALISRLPLEDR